MSDKNDRKLLSLAHAAIYLGVSKITIRRWTDDGTLPCVRIGKRGDRKFRQKDLELMDAELQKRSAEKQAD